ncbi:MAG: hypothetical protein JXR58_01395 [Bacteroidales bacterium]|nr:hypothetical protein [Bacteroidales bacterium]
MNKNFTLIYVVNDLNATGEQLIEKEDFVDKTTDFQEVFDLLDSFKAEPGLATLKNILNYSLQSSEK